MTNDDSQPVSLPPFPEQYRASGLLLHVSSLPSPYGIGDVGPAALKWIEAVEGHVLIYIHKEEELDYVERRYPAQHYVLVDDKLRILTAVKKTWNSRVTTVFPRQGQYAQDRIGASPATEEGQ